MGGSSPKAPTPPSPAQTTRESIQAQIESLPEILSAQKEFGPQFSQEALNQLGEFGPQQIEQQLRLQEKFGPQIAEALRAQRAVETPELAAAQDVLNKFLSQENLLTPNEEQQFRADSRAATSVRGLGEGGEAALEEVRGLTALRQQLKAQRLNIALSTAGRTPIGGSLVGQPQAQNQLVQNVQPSDIFGLVSNNFAQQSANFRKASKGGSGLGSAGALLGTGIGALLAAPTGGMSLAAGGMIGGAIGGGAGSLAGGFLN